MEDQIEKPKRKKKGDKNRSAAEEIEKQIEEMEKRHFESMLSIKIQIKKLIEKMDNTTDSETEKTIEDLNDTMDSLSNKHEHDVKQLHMYVKLLY